MSRAPSDDTLTRTLSRLESAAAEPAVPGDLRSWCRGVEAEAVRLTGHLETLFADRRRLYQEILGEKPELGHRVERLEERDAAMRDRWVMLRRTVEGLHGDEAEAPTASAEPVDSWEALRRDLLSWTVDVRASLAEDRTWLTEALYRDIGGDQD